MLKIGVFVVQLLSTAEEVAKLQEELETMKPLLEEAVEESKATMEKITADTVSQRVLEIKCPLQQTKQTGCLFLFDVVFWKGDRSFVESCRGNQSDCAERRGAGSSKSARDTGDCR